MKISELMNKLLDLRRNYGDLLVTVLDLNDNEFDFNVEYFTGNEDPQVILAIVESEEE